MSNVENTLWRAWLEYSRNPQIKKIEEDVVDDGIRNIPHGCNYHLRPHDTL